MISPPGMSYGLAHAMAAAHAHMPMDVLTSIAAAAPSGGGGGTDPFTYLTGLGFPGIVIGLLITGQLYPKSVVERLTAENEAKDAIIKAKDDQMNALQGGITDKVIPALTLATQTMENISRNRGPTRQDGGP